MSALERSLTEWQACPWENPLLWFLVALVSCDRNLANALRFMSLIDKQNDWMNHKTSKTTDAQRTLWVARSSSGCADTQIRYFSGSEVFTLRLEVYSSKLLLRFSSLPAADCCSAVGFHGCFALRCSPKAAPLHPVAFLQPLSVFEIFRLSPSSVKHLVVKCPPSVPSPVPLNPNPPNLAVL